MTSEEIGPVMTALARPRSPKAGGKSKRPATRSILALGWSQVPSRWRSDAWRVWLGRDNAQAMELLRMTQFDLALVRNRPSCETTWNFLRRMRLMRPSLPWALVNDPADGQPDATSEVRARMLGAHHVFDDLPTPSALEVMLRIARSRPPPAVGSASRT